MFNMFNRKNKKTALPPEVVAIDTELAGIEPQIQDAVRAEDFALAQQLKNRSVELTASREEAVEAFRQVEALHAKQEAEKVQAAELARRGRKASRKARSRARGHRGDDLPEPTVSYVTDSDAAQNIVPFEFLFDDGICRIDDHTYSMALEFDDVNYQNVRTDEQWDVLDQWAEFLNGVDDDVSLQTLLVSKHIDQHTFMQELSLPDVPGDVSGNVFRHEQNALVQSRLAASAKSMRRTRVLVLTTNATTHDKAARKLSLVADRAKRLFTNLDSECHVLDGQARMDLIVQLTRQDDLPGKMTYEDLLASPGLTTRDLVSPGRVLRLDNGDLIVGARYVRTYVVTEYAKTTRDDFLSDLTQIGYDVAVSMHIRPWPHPEAIAFAERHLNDVITENTQYQMNASKPERGFFVDAENLPRRMKTAEAEADAVVNELLDQNQRMFSLTTTIAVFGRTAEELAEACTEVEGIFREQRLGCVEHWECLRAQAFASTLPVGVCLLPYERNLQTKPLSAYHPFTSVDVMDRGGAGLGINADTHNLVFYDREKYEDTNALVLGMPGKGKSFNTKGMQNQIYLRYPDDDIICLDPEGEYVANTLAHGGAVINISEASLNHVNPLDMSLYYGSEDSEHRGNPLPLKVNFIQAMVHMMSASVSDEEKNVIDSACSVIYRDYLESGDDKDIPTLQDLFDYLHTVTGQTAADAAHLSTLMQRYVTGTFSVFNHKTDVDLDNRFIDFVISDLGADLKPLALLILLDHVWVRVTRNRREGRRTWLFIDEMQLLLDDPEAVDWFDRFWSRGRKWGLYNTAVTQNIQRLLDNEKTSYMVENTPFLVLTGQGANTAALLGERLGLSDSQARTLKTAPVGEGLYVFRHKVIHFDNTIDPRVCPHTYETMTTKFRDVKRQIQGMADATDEASSMSAATREDAAPVGDTTHVDVVPAISARDAETAVPTTIPAFDDDDMDDNWIRSIAAADDEDDAPSPTPAFDNEDMDDDWIRSIAAEDGEDAVPNPATVTATDDEDEDWISRIAATPRSERVSGGE